MESNKRVIEIDSEMKFIISGVLIGQGRGISKKIELAVIVDFKNSNKFTVTLFENPFKINSGEVFSFDVFEEALELFSELVSLNWIVVYTQGN